MAILDIGVGANCIYPIIGLRDYGWRFTGSEIDPISLGAAKMIVTMNPTLKNNVRLRQQKQPDAIFNGVIGVAERFDATLCNPPFHASEEEARASTQRKLHKLGKTGVADKPVQNFGGKHNELWCDGGEEAFVRQMVEESIGKAQNCLWFTALISRNTTLPAIYSALKRASAVEVRTIEMAQGQKNSRFVAWTYHNAEQQAAWAAERW